MVRRGHLAEREIITGIGPMDLHCPCVRDALVGLDREAA